MVGELLREIRTTGVNHALTPVLERMGIGVPNVHGFVHPEFAEVARAFSCQLRRGNGGAAVAIYHRGSPVVDIWGGSRDDDEDPWCEDTVAMSFSTTKGVASTAVHLLASRGLVDYDAPVARYWPEFAQAGKEQVTVAHVMTHSAGLHRLRTLIDSADRMLDWDYMVDALAKAAPAYEPGTNTGYHGLTYGWLVGEIVRRVDGRSLGRFIDEEISRPLELDGLYIGCPESQRHRVANLRPLGNLVFGPRPLRVAQRNIGKQYAKLFSAIGLPINTRRLVNTLVPKNTGDIMYTPEFMDAEVPSANGFFTARSLARMYAMIAGHGEIDGVRLLSPETVDEMGKIRVTRRDLILVLPMRWRLGYHRAFGIGVDLEQAFGHYGFGGSGGWADPSRDLAVAMTCNRGTGTPVGDGRLARLSGVAAKAADAADTRPH